MMRTLISGALAGMVLGACASGPEAGAPAPAASTLSDEAFRPLLQAAYFNHKPEAKADEALTELAGRSDLSASQQAEVLYRRGALRGIYVADWPMAYPQCAMRDYLAALKLGPTDTVKKQIMDGLEYQVSRQPYFQQAPFLGAPGECEQSLYDAISLLEAGS